MTTPTFPRTTRRTLSPRVRTLLLVPLLVGAVALTLPACSHHPDPVRIGAVYPLSGTQGPGGVDEFHGVEIAAQLADQAGGVGGRPIELVPIDVAGSDGASAAIDQLAGRGIRLVVGSYGSTISAPAAAAAAGRGMLFWETGAVGLMPPSDAAGRLTFRVSPTGLSLGRAAVAFVADRLAPELHRSASALRFAVVNVDDAYGLSVGNGAVDEIHALGLPLVGRFGYSLQSFDPDALAKELLAVHPDVLFVSAYVDDGVALRRATVRHHLPLLASIGTSSSYCMPAFGRRLGREAVGLFASDKPDGYALDPSGLLPDARALLAKAEAAYRVRFGGEMSAPALAGFSNAWVLFRSVLPRATSLTPVALGAAARAVRIAPGGLPNGSGVQFGAPGTPGAGTNLRAASVIWEWVGLGREAVVWPPRFATTPVRVIAPVS